MKKSLAKILAWFARGIIRKHKPRILGITGSIGKTSAKEVCFAVLSAKFHTRASPKNYNNELGVPLTVIGTLSGGTSLFKWCGVLRKALGARLGRKHYPDVLVLEMAADRPGDIGYLVKIAPPEIGIMTGVAAVHTEFLRDLHGVLEEKRTLIAALPSHGFAILNADDELVMSARDKTRARVVTYGLNKHADVRAIEYAAHFSTEEPEHAGILFKAAYNGSAVPMRIGGVLGKQHVYSALAGVGTGLAMGMNLSEISKALSGYRPPAGRMRVLPGIKRTVLIDDTYNSSPRATHLALEVLRDLDVGEGRRLAILGDMKELGAYAEEGHHEAGRFAAESRVDILVTVGELARDIARGAKSAGMNEDRIFEFMETEPAGKFVQDRAKPKDVILIKGSQSMRMERITRELMAEPLRAPELLVRQDKDWL